MPISASAVGAKLSPIQTEMTTRRLLAFAAVIGDTSPIVFDDLDARFCAAPQICVSLEWASVVANNPGAAVGATPEESLRGVHAVQDSVFHRPVRPGETLTTEGEIIGLWPGRSGTNMATRFTHAAEDGAAVFTSYMQSTFRGVALEGEARPTEDRPTVPSPSDTASAPLEEDIDVPVSLPHVFSECAELWNPIHTERAVARAAGLPDVILHGVATWSMAGRAILARYAGGDVTRLRRLRGRMSAMIVPGAPVKLHTQQDRVGDTVRVFYLIENAEGAVAIREGYAEIDGELDAR